MENSENTKSKNKLGSMTRICILLIIEMFIVTIFQFFFYVSFNKRMEEIEERIDTTSSVAQRAKESIVLILSRNIERDICTDDISEDDICNTLEIDLEELEEIKNNLNIGKDKGITAVGYNSFKNYIKNSNEKYTNMIYDKLYEESNDELYSKWYAHLLSGIINHHLGGEITEISLSQDTSELINGKIVIDYNYNIVITSTNKYSIKFDIEYEKRGIDIEKSYSFEKINKPRVPDLPSDYDNFSDTTGKPIIYIYPTQEQNVSVKLGNPELLTCSYPQYEDGWNVLAKPNGDLVDLKNNMNLYALYWEGIANKVYDYSNTSELEGFVVKGEDTIRFLEEKLSILGLNEKEREEFIIYWLPQMEDNKYNYIRFETIEEIEKEMPLQIEPKPDTTIRVLMDWKKLDEAIEVKEQELIPVERSGYTVVEWGASILNENIVR